RRRHTRFSRDWSSDVCSSDLIIANAGVAVLLTGGLGPNAFSIFGELGIDVLVGAKGTVREAISQYEAGELQPIRSPNSTPGFGRSEERRVGKECRFKV